MVSAEYTVSTFETRSRVGPDGKLHVSVPPELANTDVLVRVDPASAPNGALPPGTRPARRAMTAEEWKAFVESTAGTIPDFPGVERPGPAEYDKRDFDW